MKTISLRIDDEVDAALAALCAEQGRRETEVVADVLRRYVETERLKRMLEDPALAQLYEELAAEDKALAEEGMAEYQQTLREADRR
jgi:antitoxin component of RelBE/YafQ-DinJ toxin-antitoxin module